MEVAASLTTDSAIMAVRPMIARRGSPTCIHSDSGTDLHVAVRSGSASPSHPWTKTRSWTQWPNREFSGISFPLEHLAWAIFQMMSCQLYLFPVRESTVEVKVGQNRSGTSKCHSY